MSFDTLNKATGVYVISVTPFLPDGAIDFESLDRLVDFYASAGATGLTILGMMGEAQKLTQAESVQVTERVLARAGALPVVVGVSAPGLAAVRELGLQAMNLGAAGVMITPPMTLRTDDQIINYYHQADEALGSDVPIVLQDFPLATGVQISNAALGRIIEGVPSIAMLKHEDWPGLAKISALREAEAGGRRRISILTGNGGIFLPEEMVRGADGAMTGFSYPEMMVGVCRLMAEGRTDAAQDLFDAYLPFARYEQQPGLGLAIRKHILARRGVIAHDALRKPGQRLSAEDIKDIDLLIARQEQHLRRIG
ncbi:dihydrodipicolinate synthase family protein [Falsirhodobacter xinxiangensis]|uniref:dihydrodipicolinate synthase family protein n=1 Tax=Falsirhodobacter xinxiangensis TaxID=2530049 RepID=UPI0010AA97AA|nr:dihydrodipicolinate synthase family protein [Rhodobacter xinxiangensis]